MLKRVNMPFTFWPEVEALHVKEPKKASAIKDRSSGAAPPRAVHSLIPIGGKLIDDAPDRFHAARGVKTNIVESQLCKSI